MTALTLCVSLFTYLSFMILGGILSGLWCILPIGKLSPCPPKSGDQAKSHPSHLQMGTESCLPQNHIYSLSSQVFPVHLPHAWASES